MQLDVKGYPHVDCAYGLWDVLVSWLVGLYIINLLISAIFLTIAFKFCFFTPGLIFFLIYDHSFNYVKC